MVDRVGSGWKGWWGWCGSGDSVDGGDGGMVWKGTVRQVWVVEMVLMVRDGRNVGTVWMVGMVEVEKNDEDGVYGEDGEDGVDGEDGGDGGMVWKGIVGEVQTIGVSDYGRGCGAVVSDGYGGNGAPRKRLLVDVFFTINIVVSIVVVVASNFYYEQVSVNRYRTWSLLGVDVNATHAHRTRQCTREVRKNQLSAEENSSKETEMMCHATT
ncbi:unnamed protein product [Cylicostephanus goldi]|uniref:Uncharacterized protein n=1 Tax=Cylicostephanus goldi TaxID=71465 RepID=A0A3P6RAB0_CYLGO|nr:unnamed protein product [Cylicostephanus goldi]